MICLGIRKSMDNVNLDLHDRLELFKLSNTKIVLFEGNPKEGEYNET